MENIVTSGKATCTCKDAAVDVAAVGAPGAKKVIGCKVTCTML
jgi:hypothetical protein